MVSCKWFQETWISCSWRWIRAYKEEAFQVQITTTNGVESLNKLLKYTYLPHAPDKSLNSIIKTLIEDYYPTHISRYLKKNFNYTGINKKFNESLPTFMHRQPTSFIKQCRKIYQAAELDFQDIKNINDFLFSSKHPIYDVKSVHGSGVYTINWTFTTYKPYPCKHIFLLTMVVPTLSWENLPSDYTEQSLFTADTTNELFENIKPINPISTQQKLTNHKDKEETENDNNDEYDNTFIEDDE